MYLVHTDSSPAARVIDFEKATYDEVKNWIEKNRQLLREGAYGKIIYPEGSFDFRRQETADRILGEVRDGLEPIALIALTIGNPVLAAQRAFMLGGSLDSGLRLPTHVVDSGDAEAIVIVAPKDGS